MGLEQTHKSEFKMRLTCTTKKIGQLMQVEWKWCGGFSRDNLKHKLYTPATFEKKHHSSVYSMLLHTPSISSFIQRLNLRTSTVAQVIARLWHNARPRKVGALTWLTLNNGLPVGTWLQKMGIPAPCKRMSSRVSGICSTLSNGLPARPTCVEGLHEALGGMGDPSPPHHYLAFCASWRSCH